MSRPATWFAVAAVIVVAAVVALVLSRPPDPFNQPGTSWIRSDVTSQSTIRLLDSGRYVESQLCDICGSPSRFSGKWRDVPMGYELTPDKGDPPKVYRRINVDRCQVLVRTNKRADEWNLYYRNGKCVAALPEK